MSSTHTEARPGGLCIGSSRDRPLESILEILQSEICSGRKRCSSNNLAEQNMLEQNLKKIRALPAYANLVAMVHGGHHPNFLDVMAAISEIVAFTTNSDAIAEADVARSEEMSQNNCRICS